jgi:hypothetical protein
MPLGPAWSTIVISEMTRPLVWIGLADLEPRKRQLRPLRALLSLLLLCNEFSLGSRRSFARPWRRRADARRNPQAAIVYAAAGVRLDVLKQLLARQVNINARYPNELTLPMWPAGPDEKAAEARAIEVVAYLLDASSRHRE